MPWKLDDAGNVISEGGKPIFVHPDGKEFGFDGDGTVATIGRLKDGERISRERMTELETKHKPFEGLDPEETHKAVSTYKNLEGKKLIDAGEVEKVKQEAIKAAEAQWLPFKQENETLKAALHSEKIGGSFNRSKFIADKCAIPADMIQSRFGQNFKLEDGKVVAYDGNGNKLYSRARPGEVADFDEALETLIEQYPYKDHILKGSGASGSGTSSGKGGGGTGKSMSRAQFDQLPVFEQGKFVRGGGKITD